MAADESTRRRRWVLWIACPVAVLTIVWVVAGPRFVRRAPRLGVPVKATAYWWAHSGDLSGEELRAAGEMYEHLASIEGYRWRPLLPIGKRAPDCGVFFFNKGNRSRKADFSFVSYGSFVRVNGGRPFKPGRADVRKVKQFFESLKPSEEEQSVDGATETDGAD